MLVTLDGVGNLVGLIAEIGGKPIPDQNLGQIINKMGASGGAVFGNNPTLIQGAGGGYQYNISAWGGIPKPGHAVSEINLSIPAMTQYLYRNNIGVPTANQMDTAIDIGGPTGRGRNTLMSDLLKAKNKKPSLFQTMNNFINDCLYSYLRSRNYFRLNFEKPIEFFYQNTQK